MAQDNKSNIEKLTGAVRATLASLEAKIKRSLFIPKISIVASLAILGFALTDWGPRATAWIYARYFRWRYQDNKYRDPAFVQLCQEMFSQNDEAKLKADLINFTKNSSQSYNLLKYLIAQKDDLALAKVERLAPSTFRHINREQSRDLFVAALNNPSPSIVNLLLKNIADLPWDILKQQWFSQKQVESFNYTSLGR